ncbi:PREDICTED: uncharacterized protein LOC106331249 [Brassica oleracea var. oleracea]|uniref:uncharacterized protein LOC106331249 n=1 Tax=Brassica oleracea var. oleracea TaxID=109376 RepID=UPI0006A7431E|nr:PREDICTED: uncharacterized protein LOC106331249 [Brassica oleracea var. oleracea]
MVQRFYENSQKGQEDIRNRLDAALSDLQPDETLIQKLNSDLLQLYKAEEYFWKQRSRQLWLSLGDSNTGYFHAISKGRSTQNRLSVIEDKDGLPHYEEEQIANIISSFYADLFKSSEYLGNQILFHKREITEATFSIIGEKAPGPDGFSASFFPANWEVVGPAVISEIQAFFSTGFLAPSINKTHVRLIPKFLGAKTVEEYMPIALCNIYYKIISKLISIRLKNVLGVIVSENQSAFVSGRAIADNVLITHEVLQFLKTSKAEIRCSMAVKTDMSKAYDRIEWQFISDVLYRLGFHAIWINWIMQCITTVSYSYLINETVYGNVLPLRGIRQGDPLSPYVFILCGEVLSGLCREAGRKGLLQGIRVARGCPRINHLLFADDTMFFCLASQSKCEALQAVLTDYGKSSGQMINKNKSSITFSSKTPPAIKENAKSVLGITKEGGLGKYLGLLEHFGRRKRDLFTSIVDRIRQKALSWSARRLSKAGKLTMLKAVLSAIPTYSMSCFQLPVSLCKRIQSVLTRFWWDETEGKKKICWVAWDQLTKPKALGGLGLRDIQRFNQALLAKLAWRIITAPESLFSRILMGKYCHNKSFLEIAPSQSCSHGWRSILHGRDLLKENLGKSIGNGQTTKIWKDSWISLDKVLKPMGPIKVSALDLTVADLLTSELKWNKQRIEELLPDLAEQIQCYFAATSHNHHTQLTRAEGEFSWIRDIWAGKFSPKMKTFLWSIVHKAISLSSNLQRRGMTSATPCVRCQDTENEMHCFFNCQYAKNVWDLMPLSKAVHLAAGVTFPEVVVKFRRVICLPPSGISLNILRWVLWAIWTARNTLIFEGRYQSPEETTLNGIKLARERTNSQNQSSGKKDLPQSQQFQSRAPPQINLDNDQVTCKTDAAWHKEKLVAGLGWVFSGPRLESPIKGSMCEASIGSPLVAEASAVRSAMCMAINLEFSSLEVLSDNLTLIQAISGITQAKEIIDIVKDI